MTEQPMQGGYRRPSSPAPVSGPGAMSRRTDGQGARYMSGGEYGEGQEMMDLQTSAPMSKTETRSPRPRSPRATAGTSDVRGELTPLFAPSERPDEPITAGMPFGAGPNARSEQNTRGRLTSTLEKIIQYDSSSRMNAFYMMAKARGW